MFRGAWCLDGPVALGIGGSAGGGGRRARPRDRAAGQAKTSGPARPPAPAGSPRSGTRGKATTAAATDSPTGWASQVSDVVNGVLFLESSPHVTGEIVHIHGAPKSPGHRSL